MTKEASIGKANTLQNEYKLLESVDFFVDIIKEIQSAKSRIWIQTMALEACHMTNLIIHHLKEAVGRGVDVRIVYDAYSNFIIDNNFVTIPSLKKENRQYNRFLLACFTQLKTSLQSSFLVNVTNVPIGFLRNMPLHGIMGRDHKKITIIDDVGYLGGLNFTNLDARRKDFMFKMNNYSIVCRLAQIFENSFNNQNSDKNLLWCDINNTVLTDAGESSKSSIIELVYDLVTAETQSIKIISPFTPTGNLRKLLNNATIRGVKVEVYTSEIKSLGFKPILSQIIHNFGHEKILFDIIRFPGIVHAKAILFAEHTAIFGSHNFDELLVFLGTEEVSLYTKDPAIISQLKNYAYCMYQVSNLQVNQ